MTLGFDPVDGDLMTQVKDVLTVVPTLLLSVVALLGMALLIGMSAWELPVRPAH